MELAARVEWIVDEVTRLRERGVVTFGSERHGFVYAPPLPEDELAALERTHGIALPADYRAFLRHAGHGAGPYYGLVAPARWGELLRPAPAMPDWATRPCVWSPELSRDEATWQRVGAPLEQPFAGAITLCDQGSVYHAALVITGPARGRVMYLNQNGGVPYFPEHEDFISWYERWVDELRWGHRHEWFGMGMPGEEATLADAAGEDRPRRRDALQAMQRLPALGAATVAVVGARVRDADPEVRGSALELVASFELGAVLPDEVHLGLVDALPAHRLTALRAWVAADVAWHDDARAALRDPDEQVVLTAMLALAKAEVLGDVALVELVGSAVPTIRETALTIARAVPSPLLLDALLPIARAERPPAADVLQALLGQIRSGIASAPQREAALDVVLQRLAHASPPDTLTSLRAVGAFIASEPRALALLLAALGDPDPVRRFQATGVLGDDAGPAVIPALAQLIDDPTMPQAEDFATLWSVGENARRAIARIEARLIGGPGFTPTPV
jgi:hypothetical protein